MGPLVRRLQEIRAFCRVIQAPESSYLLGRSRSNSSNFSNGLEHKPWEISSFLNKGQNVLPWTQGRTMTLRSTMAVELSIFLIDKRLVTTQARPPPQARQMAGLKVAISSPGLIYEPYAPRERVSFWKRWFTKSGWRRTKEDIILELKSAYAIAKLRKTGYSKQQFYQEAIELYKEINTLLANGDKTTIRKAVTEKMYSELKNEIKQRESRWNKIYWEMIEPVIKIRTLRARLIGVDRNDLNKAFIQLTLEFMTKQKFEAYDSKGNVVAGDKNKEVQEMDRRYHQFLFLDICNRLYNFISKCLTTQALKTVNLGHPRARDDTASEDAEEASQDRQFASPSSSSKDHEQDCKGLLTVQDTDDNIHEKKAIDSVGVEKAPEAEASLPSLPPEAKPPKKVVSMNDRPEEIKTSQRKVKRTKSAEKTTSMERDDVPKPLKSILKVGSSIRENQNSLATLLTKDEL